MARTATTPATSAAPEVQPQPSSQPRPERTRVSTHTAARRRRPKLFRRVWILVVIMVVVAIAAFLVLRLHGVFGKTETTRPGSGLANDTKPFNPKRVKYEIFGPPGTVATINYLDLDAQPRDVKDVPLPWTLLLTTTAPAASANIIAQGDSDSISCRITVNDEVKDENTSEGVNAQTFCWVKSA